jgi:hypothetical protein
MLDRETITSYMQKAALFENFRNKKKEMKRPNNKKKPTKTKQQRTNDKKKHTIKSKITAKLFKHDIIKYLNQLTSLESSFSFSNLDGSFNT